MNRPRKKEARPWLGKRADEEVSTPAGRNNSGTGEGMQVAPLCYELDLHHWINQQGRVYGPVKIEYGDWDLVEKLGFEAWLAIAQSREIAPEIRQRFLASGKGVAIFGMANAADNPRFRKMAGSDNSDPWKEKVDNVTEADIQVLAHWRGYAFESAQAIVRAGLIGKHHGAWAFPVRDGDGKFLGVHELVSQQNKAWIYDPKGIGAWPLVQGSLKDAQQAFILESSWDWLTFLLLSSSLSDPPVPVICTRGAQTFAKLKTLWHPAINVIAIPQNDDPGTQWLANVRKLGVQTLRVLRVPESFKDLNDWLSKGGLTDRQLLAAIEHASFIDLETARSPLVDRVAEQPKAPEELEAERIAALYERYEILQPKPLAEASRILPPELIAGILYQGRRMLLTGASKARKSWMLHQMAYSLANGLLERFATKQTRIFYVNFELMEAGSALRFDAIAKALGCGSQDNITIISISDYLDLIGTDFPEYLALLARDNRAGATIVDPMWRLLGERDENSNTAIGQLLRPLVRFSREAHASMIGAHHHAKGNASAKEAIDQASGAGAFIRDPATILVMSPHKQDDAYIVTVKSNDFAPIDNFVIRFDYPLFLVDETLDPSEVRPAPHVNRAKQKSDSQTRQVLTAIRTRESPDQEAGLIHAEIVRATGILRGTVTKILKRLIRDRMVYKSVAGTEERYALTAWFRAKMDAETAEMDEMSGNGEEL
jgi:hypothetical protein